MEKNLITAKGEPSIKNRTAVIKQGNRNSEYASKNNKPPLVFDKKAPAQIAATENNGDECLKTVSRSRHLPKAESSLPLKKYRF